MIANRDLNSAPDASPSVGNDLFTAALDPWDLDGFADHSSTRSARFEVQGQEGIVTEVLEARPFPKVRFTAATEIS